MTDRLRALRLVIVLGYTAVGLGVALFFFGPAGLIPLPALILLGGVPALDWVTGRTETARVMGEMQIAGPTALTSEQMDWAFREQKPVVIDDDPKWGKLVEGRERTFGQTLTAVQVINSTPEPDGTYKKVWLRVPSRGDRQGTRECQNCGADIAWPPRTAREAIAWTFRLCTKHYKPAKAS